MSSDLTVLTHHHVFKKLDMVTLKSRQIDFTDWFCPIYKGIINISPSGQIHSGVCGNVFHTKPCTPWWKLDSLEINKEDSCKLVYKNCFCDADILRNKAKDKGVYDFFIKYKPTYKQHLLLPEVNDDDIIIALGHVARKERDVEVHFHIGRMCNFDCSYCPGPNAPGGGIHDNFSPHMSLENFKKCMQLVEPHVSKNRRLFITGGEPTLNPRLLEMIEYAQSIGYSISINTNGTAPSNVMSRLLETGSQLLISFHVEFTNNKVLEKVSTLVEKYRDQMFVKVMAYEDMDYAAHVRTYFPNTNLQYFPIYGRDLEHNYYSKQQ